MRGVWSRCGASHTRSQVLILGDNQYAACSPPQADTIHSLAHGSALLLHQSVQACLRITQLRVQLVALSALLSQLLLNTLQLLLCVVLLFHLALLGLQGWGSKEEGGQ